MTASEKPGQILVIGGTSGSGKSSTAERWARRAEDFWLLYGVDNVTSELFPSRYGYAGSKAREGIVVEPVDAADPDGSLRWSFGPYGIKAMSVLHEWIASASRLGCNIVFDQLMTLDPPVLQDCIWRMEGLPVLFVQLKPPIDVLRDRVLNRTNLKAIPVAENSGEDPKGDMMRMLGQMVPWFYEASYANTICDLEIDTTSNDLETVCDLIAARLAEGPGTAFETLRQIHPQPASVGGERVR